MGRTISESRARIIEKREREGTLCHGTHTDCTGVARWRLWHQVAGEDRLLPLDVCLAHERQIPDVGTNFVCVKRERIR